MEAIKDYLDMGGYGVYIWPSYVVTAVVLIAMLIASLRLLRGNEAALKALETSTEEKTGEKKA